jgi:DNA-binding NarL/FixJ family response regulator
MIEIVLADDDAGVLAALRALFADDDRFDVVGDAADAVACISLVHDLDPDVVLLDARMPGSGLAATQELRAAGARAAVVVLSARLDARLLAGFIDAGVQGAFDKGSVSESLPDLVARCVAGERLLHARSTPDALRLLSSH